MVLEGEAIEKNKNLRDVFELYKEYTGFKGDYDNNTFSTKLRSVIDKYNLKDYIECFNEKREAYVGYAFTEEEANMLAMTIPMFFVGKRFEAGKELGNVSILDLAPTIANIMNVTKAKESRILRLNA